MNESGMGNCFCEECGHLRFTQEFVYFRKFKMGCSYCDGVTNFVWVKEGCVFILDEVEL
jgi:hypothetical protein